jgi:peptidoglycan hydrolase-like protein with peptidoglycan-binding domain
MLPRSSFRSTVTASRPWLAGGFVTAIVLALAGTLLSVPAYAANPVTPGNFRGLGFDQCEAPSQAAMSTWIKKSPYRAAGIYISGNSRACRRQSNLSATWVRNQLAAGWHLMPITLGPQASCSSRYPRYGWSIDPKINPSTANVYRAARAQGIAEARKTVAAARTLGIVTGSTMFYDLEAFSTSSVSCRDSALWFLTAWTQELHRWRYASGVYSSAASGIKMLDDARFRAGTPFTMPDQVWIADWNGKANNASSYVRPSAWMPYQRAHQYMGGHNETWGGVRINIDRNFLDLRTPRLPGVATPPPAPAPTSPRYTGTSLSDPRCTPATINKPSYVPTNATTATSLIVPLQCVLKQQRLYPYEVTGRWNTQTTTGYHAFLERTKTGTSRTYVGQADWIRLLVAGNGGTQLRAGSSGADVVRVQRALNAAYPGRLKITGSYDAATATAVGAYQRATDVTVTKIVGPWTWSRLGAGRH